MTNEEQKKAEKTEEKIHPSMAGMEKKEAVGEKMKEERKIEEQKTEEKTASKKQEKPKKTEAVVNAYNISVSTKTSAAICRFIKGKKIQNAISDLEEVIRQRKAIPMKGEIPHRKGKIMSGRFPRAASKEFIKILKSLAANTSYADIEEPIIFEAIPNKGSRPYGRFGTIRRKRTHIRIVARSKINVVKNK